MSFFHLVSIHLKLAGAGHLLHTGELPGSSRCPLVRHLLHVLCHTGLRLIILFPTVEARPVVKILIRLADSSTCVLSAVFVPCMKS